MVIILRISDLQNKDIVDIKSGEKIGNIVDIEVDGKGMILKVIPAGGDTMLEIGFETAGTKKIMANFAKLTIL